MQKTRIIHNHNVNQRIQGWQLCYKISFDYKPKQILGVMLVITLGKEKESNDKEECERRHLRYTDILAL